MLCLSVGLVRRQKHGEGCGCRRRRDGGCGGATSSSACIGGVLLLQKGSAAAPHPARLASEGECSGAASRANGDGESCCSRPSPSSGEEVSDSLARKACALPARCNKVLVSPQREFRNTFRTAEILQFEFCCGSFLILIFQKEQQQLL
nr:uncharacterized protein LOC127296669 isoform X2 [Lolium perenne]